jgi:hypothetical protein
MVSVFVVFDASTIAQLMLFFVIPVTFEPTPALMSAAPEPVPLLVQGLGQRARRRRRAPRVQRGVTAARRTRAGAGGQIDLAGA